MGATMVAVPIYSAVGRTWQATASQRKRDLERCTRNLKEVARYAEDKGVKLAVEPLNRFETSFINLAEQAVEPGKRVDGPAVGFMIDTFHANIEEKSIGKAIETAGHPRQRSCGMERDRGCAEDGQLQWCTCH